MDIDIKVLKLGKGFKTSEEECKHISTNIEVTRSDVFVYYTTVCNKCGETTDEETFKQI